MKMEEILAVLGEVSFEDNQIQVLSLRRGGSEIGFPLTAGPINFCVLSDGGMLVRWGVRVGRKGDAYIYNRDVRKAEKVSLHVSGCQHIAINGDTAVQVGADNRFGPRWTEPVFDQSAVPTFSMLFPPWGVTDKRPGNLARENGELLIVGHVKKVVAVGFFIIDSNRTLRVDAPHFTLGKLALRAGKVLHVVAWKEPENNLKTLLRASMAQAPSPLPEADDLVVNFQGFRAPNSAFMVAVPAAALG